MTPDWDGKPVTVPYAEFGDPQSLNLYAYVRNSPIARVDADGHMAVMFTSTGVGYVGGYGVDDDSGGFPDPFSVTWIPGNFTTTITFKDGSTQTLVNPGDMAVSGSSGGAGSVDSQKVGKFSVGQLAGVLFNESRDLALVGPSQPGQDPLENAKTAEANAIYNNASLKKPHKMATPKVSKKLQKTAQYRQDLQIMRAVYTSRTSGGSDPAAGRTYFGNSAEHLNSRPIGGSRHNSRPIGGSRQTVFERFGPFAFGSNPPEYIYIYNDPK